MTDTNEVTWYDPQTDTVKTQPIDPSFSSLERRIAERAMKDGGIDADAWYNFEKDEIQVKIRVYYNDPGYPECKAGVILLVPLSRLYAVAEGMEYPKIKVR